MTRINEELTEEAHKILKSYQHQNGIRAQGAALNQLLVRFKELLEKEAKTYWEIEPTSMLSDEIPNTRAVSWTPRIPFQDGDIVMFSDGTTRMLRTKEGLQGEKK
jgi:hypothetical protein